MYFTETKHEVWKESGYSIHLADCVWYFSQNLRASIERKKESNFRRHAFVWSVKLAKFSDARNRVQPRAMTRLARLNEPGSGSPWRVLSTTTKFPRTGFNNTISFGKVARQRGRHRSRVRTMRKLICTDTLEINTARAVTIASKSF